MNQSQSVAAVVVCGRMPHSEHGAKVVDSLIAAGFSAVIPHHCSEAGFRASTPMGDWIGALSQVYLSHPHADYFAVVEDDVTLCGDLLEYLRQSLPEDDIATEGRAAFWSPYCPGVYMRQSLKFSWFDVDAGWKMVGACFIIFPRRSVEMILQDADVYRWAVDGKAVDSYLGRWAKAVGRMPRYHSPSLIQHVGLKPSDDIKTTLRQAADFIGVTVSAVKAATHCDKPTPPTRPCPIVIAPRRNEATTAKPWEGSRPWDNSQVTAIIPVLERSEMLDMVMESLLLQTQPPLIYLVDTGSIETTAALQSLRQSNTVEVLSVRLQGWIHPSEPVAAALDAAWPCVHTPFAFLCHDDTIFKDRQLLEKMTALTRLHAAVGYQITERPYPEWKTELGHSCTMLDVAIMDRIGMRWNMRAYSHATGKPLDPSVCGPNDPDTEREMNRLLHLHGIVPFFIGAEQNHRRTNDAMMDHCRSLTSGILYSPERAAVSSQWSADAVEQAKQRHATWRTE